MKKVNLLSREELKKVHGGGPPPIYWVQCRDLFGVDMGVPIQVDTCEREWMNMETVCREAGFPTADMHYSTCQGW